MDNLARSVVVSSESEQLILVDSNDREIGFESKGNCHDGNGILHRAFSLFIFNADGEVLMQQRSADKRLWPLYWSNSCCSHPRAGESMDEAVGRRLDQELGMTSSHKLLYKFEYQARFKDLGSEHELCWVYIGRSDDPVRANATEIADWRWLAPAALSKEVAAHPGRFTPWFKMEWERLLDQHADDLAAL